MKHEKTKVLSSHQTKTNKLTVDEEWVTTWKNVNTIVVGANKTPHVTFHDALFSR